MPHTEEHKIKIGLANSKWEHLKGEKSSNWKGGKPKCIICGKELSNYGKKRCKKHIWTGIHPPNWIEDRTKLKRINSQGERRTSIYDEWRSRVYKRDNWKCRVANEDCDGKIVAHHIKGYTDYPKLRYELTNGITLCQAHHPRTRAKEKALIPVFQELIQISEE